MNAMTTTYLDNSTATEGEDIPEPIRDPGLIPCPNAEENPAEPCRSNAAAARVAAVKATNREFWRKRTELVMQFEAGTINAAQFQAEAARLLAEEFAENQGHKDQEQETVQQQCCDEASAPSDGGQAA